MVDNGWSERVVFGSADGVGMVEGCHVELVVRG